MERTLIPIERTLIPLSFPCTLHKEGAYWAPGLHPPNRGADRSREERGTGRIGSVLPTQSTDVAWSDVNRITLDEIAARTDMLEVRCSRCDRRGRINVRRLMLELGPRADMPDLAGDRPKRDGTIMRRCNVFFPELPASFGVR
jgi:hypothetical protein